MFFRLIKTLQRGPHGSGRFWEGWVGLIKDILLLGCLLDAPPSWALEGLQTSAGEGCHVHCCHWPWLWPGLTTHNSSSCPSRLPPRVWLADLIAGWLGDFRPRLSPTRSTLTRCLIVKATLLIETRCGEGPTLIRSWHVRCWMGLSYACHVCQQRFPSRHGSKPRLQTLLKDDFLALKWWRGMDSGLDILFLSKCESENKLQGFPVSPITNEVFQFQSQKLIFIPYFMPHSLLML